MTFVNSLAGRAVLKVLQVRLCLLSPDFPTASFSFFLTPSTLQHTHFTLPVAKRSFNIENTPEIQILTAIQFPTLSQPTLSYALATNFLPSLSTQLTVLWLFPPPRWLMSFFTAFDSHKMWDIQSSQDACLHLRMTLKSFQQRPCFLASLESK